MAELNDPKRARVERLRAARVNDSRTKREATLAVVAHLLHAGERVTFARVAREASVSTWLVYNVPEITAAVRQAMAKQRQDGISPSPPRLRHSHQTPESLRTDLTLARDEVQSLRAENAKLSQRLRIILGAEAEEATLPELTERIAQLETSRATLLATLAERDQQVEALVEARDALESELEGKVEALRRLMMTVNTRPI